MIHMEGSCANKGGGWSPVVVSLSIVILLVLSGLPTVSPEDGTRGNEPVFLMVGQLDSMRTKNPLPSIADNVWTQDIFDLVYDTVGKISPGNESIVPYIVKGVDADDDGVFEREEYGVFSKEDGTDQLNITAYYDFNGVYFHDGVQATVADLFFSYHLQAMNPRMRTSLLSLMDMAGRSGSNHTTTRWLFVLPATKSWQDEPTVGNSSLRVAVRFSLQEPFVLFYRKTLAGCVLYPRHIWEGTGWRMYGTAKVANLHGDFGYAIYSESDPKFGQGVPLSSALHFIYNKPQTPEADSAEEWQPLDDDVIGSGPFEFDSFYVILASVSLLKNTLYYTGVDQKTGLVHDAYVTTYIHLPYIDGINFREYTSVDILVSALRVREIDYIRWGLSHDYIPYFSNNPNARIWIQPPWSFIYLSYNLRGSIVGVYNWSTLSAFDVGLHFRKAVAHVVDKIAWNRAVMGGYGIPGVTSVPPTNERFYNESLVPYELNFTKAREEIELAHQDAVWLSTHGGPAEASTWFTWETDGTLNMPYIRNSSLTLGCPRRDHILPEDPICDWVTVGLSTFGIKVIRRSYPIQGPIPIFCCDMFIRGEWITGPEPDYFYKMFHSSETTTGGNHAGFMNTTLDWILDETRKEFNENRRMWLFKWAQGILSEHLPIDVINFPNYIEVTRQDRFVGWNSLDNSIWNYWSLLNVWPPDVLAPWNKKLTLNLETPSAIVEDSCTVIIATVKDHEGNLMDDADVKFDLAPHGGGSLQSDSDPPSMSVSGKTVNGKVTILYRAPSTDDVLNATITATVTYLASAEVSRSKMIAVYPDGVEFLRVTIRPQESDLVHTGGSLSFGIEITTPLGLTKNDAFVTAMIEPEVQSPYGLTETNGTAAMMTSITFKAPTSSNLPFDETVFVLTVNASYPGYLNGTYSTGFVVIKRYKTCPDGSQILEDRLCPHGDPAFSLIEFLCTLSVLGFLTIVAIALAVKNRGKAKPPPSDPRKE